MTRQMVHFSSVLCVLCCQQVYCTVCGELPSRHTEVCGEVSGLVGMVLNTFMYTHTDTHTHTHTHTLPRLLTVRFDNGYLSEVYETLAGGLKTVDIDTMLQVIPQLIARIDPSCRLVRKLIHDLLTAIGKQHPQVGEYEV